MDAFRSVLEKVKLIYCKIKWQHYFSVQWLNKCFLQCIPPVNGPSVEALKHQRLHLHFDCEFVTYLPLCSQCGGRGIHGNSVAYSKSFYSNCTDSLQQMSEMPFLQLTPKRKSTTQMTKPWPKVKRKAWKIYCNKLNNLNIIFVKHISYKNENKWAVLQVLNPGLR